MRKFRHSSIVFEKPGILPEKLKTLTSFLLINVYKSLFVVFFILLRSWVIYKNLKRPGFYILTESIFINNPRSKQNKKNPKHRKKTFLTRKRVQNFSKKILNSMVIGARQSFKFSS